ncbi:MAG: HEAT repeat domain-containing protein [Planctomycetota bacterium]
MEPQGPPEVLFCDLCNTSVPLQDFEAGRAVRHQGKAIGACCLGALGVGAVTAAGAASSVAPAAGSPGAPAHQVGPMPARAAGEGRLLPLGIALLGAIAAATLFLDFRIDQVEGRATQRGEELAQSLKAQAEVVQGMSLALDGAVRRADFDEAVRRLGAIEAGQRQAGAELDAVGQGHARTTAALAALQQAIADLDARRPDHGPMLEELMRQMRQQAVTLAELLARPRPVEVPAPESNPVPAAAPGLAPDLQHQIGRLRDDDAATRFEAVDELLRSKDPAVLEHLLPMTTDPDTFVRRLVVEGLKDFPRPAVVDALIVALADPEEIVRDTAWRSLKDLTGQKLPFDASGSREVQRRGQQKWQEWWDKNRDSFGS